MVWTLKQTIFSSVFLKQTTIQFQICTQILLIIKLCSKQHNQQQEITQQLGFKHSDSFPAVNICGEENGWSLLFLSNMSVHAEQGHTDTDKNCYFVW